MSALIPTTHVGTIIWLGHQPDPAENQIIRALPLQEMALGFGGYAGESHAGLTRPSCSRVLAQYPRGTEIRNVRQLCVVSAEEMDAVAAGLGLADWDHAWVGASVVISGIPDFTHIPPSSRLQTQTGATLTVDMENHPCIEPAKTIELVHPGRGKAFKDAARGRRGITAWVEREGVLRLGDKVTLHVPEQRPWAP
jgi:MOSC domain